MVAEDLIKERIVAAGGAADKALTVDGFRKHRNSCTGTHGSRLPDYGRGTVSASWCDALQDGGATTGRCRVDLT